MFAAGYMLLAIGLMYVNYKECLSGMALDAGFGCMLQGLQ